MEMAISWNLLVTYLIFSGPAINVTSQNKLFSRNSYNLFTISLDCGLTKRLSRVSDNETNEPKSSVVTS